MTKKNASPAAKRKAKGGLTAAAKTLGSRGGKIGGPARNRALTPEQRKRIATMGGKARQKKKDHKNSKR